MLAFAVENSPGDAVVAELERGFDADRPIDWRAALFPMTVAQTDGDTASEPSGAAVGDPSGLLE